MTRRVPSHDQSIKNPVRTTNHFETIAKHGLFQQFLGGLHLTAAEFRTRFIEEIAQLPSEQIITLDSWIHSDGSEMNAEQQRILLGVLRRVATHALSQASRS